MVHSDGRCACVRRIEPGKLRSVNGLPADTDLSAILGRTLEQVAIGSYQVQLRFDEHVTVSVEGDYAVPGADGLLGRFPSPPERAVALVALLGQVVVDAQVTDPGTTTLRFSSEQSVEIFDSESNFESYEISIGERLIIV
jgi:hypothetical protein